MSLLHFFPLKDIEVVAAKNATLTLADGREVLDVGGASHGAAIIGHSHPDVVAAVQAQAAQIMHVAHLYPNPARAQFLDTLHGLLPSYLDRTFMCNSGTEAVEACLKFAVAATGRGRFVAAENGFHGRTLAALSVTHKPLYREPMSSVTAPCDFVPYNDVDALTATVSNKTAAIVLEPVQGEGGVVPGTGEYLQAARDLATDHGALLMFDEVQTGMGRTGPFLAAQTHGVEPDLVSMGKGLAGGIPIGLAITSAVIAARLPGGFHGSTYGASPIQAAAGAAALNAWSNEKLGQRSTDEGARMLKALQAIDNPAITQVRGAGLMLTIDLKIKPAPVLQHLQDAGFLALAGGARGVRLLPPLTTPRDQLDATVAAVTNALETAVEVA